jgi:NitT/TauT family transport system ATP-binding protein
MTPIGHELGIENVSKRFVLSDASEVTALRGINLRVAPAEVMSIVGPSGCGKSTLLRMIAGFEKPSEGRILLGGHPIVRPGLDRGVVFQQPALYPWLDVFDNIAFGPRMRGRPKNQYRPQVTRFIQAVGLEGSEHHYPYQLSGGMKQRLQIARVLINAPELLLMDEPFGALDAQTRLDMQELLLQLLEQHRPTIFFITHDVEEAIFLSDQVCVMSARPGSVVDTFRIPFERPRLYANVAASPDFAALKLKILSLVHRKKG